MIKAGAKNRSRRLRKKLFVDEFNVQGFEVDMSFAQGITDEAIDGFFDDFLANVIEANELVFAGGGNSEGFSGFVIPSARYSSATEEHRKLLAEWFDKNELITEHSSSELVDANFVL